MAAVPDCSRAVTGFLLRDLDLSYHDKEKPILFARELDLSYHNMEKTI